jgi:hypothetical protein
VKDIGVDVTVSLKLILNRMRHLVAHSSFKVALFQFPLYVLSTVSSVNKLPSALTIHSLFVICIHYYCI